MTREDHFTAAARIDPLADPDPIRHHRRPACRYPVSPCGQPPGSPTRTCDPHHLVLEYLQKIQADLAGVETTLGEHTLRLQWLEVAIAHLRRDIAHGETAPADVSARIDQLTRHVERIEQWLGLAE